MPPVAPGIDPVAETSESIFTINQLHLAALDLVVARIRHFTGPGQFIQVTSYGIFDEPGAARPSSRAICSSLACRVGFKLHFHDVGLFRASPSTKTHQDSALVCCWRGWQQLESKHKEFAHEMRFQADLGGRNQLRLIAWGVGGYGDSVTAAGSVPK